MAPLLAKRELSSGSTHNTYRSTSLRQKIGQTHQISPDSTELGSQINQQNPTFRYLHSRFAPLTFLSNKAARVSKRMYEVTIHLTVSPCYLVEVLVCRASQNEDALRERDTGPGSHSQLKALD